MTDRLEPQDPRNQYPRPPFSTPTQEMPGLVTNMMPFLIMVKRPIAAAASLPGARRS